MRRQLLGLSSALILASGTVWAQDVDELFGKLDSNKDGYVTPDEVPDAQKALYDRLVRTSDKNGDGRLNKDELQAGLKPEDGAKPPLGGAQGFPGRPGGPRGGGAPPPIGGRPNLDREQLEALFDRTDSNSDGKLTKDEIPEERQGMRGILERAGGETLSKDQFVRGMLAMAQAGGQPPRPEGARPDGAPARRPDGQPGGPPGGLPGGGLFGALDADRNGEISNAEMLGAGTALLKLDRNGDGKLTPEEVFASGGPPGGPPGARPGEGRPGPRGAGGPGSDEFRQRMREADANKDGKISKDEAPPMLKERFDRVDTNGDGYIDQEESRRMFDRGGNPPGRRPGDRPAKSDKN